MGYYDDRDRRGYDRDYDRRDRDYDRYDRRDDGYDRDYDRRGGSRDYDRDYDRRDRDYERDYDRRGRDYDRRDRDYGRRDRDRKARRQLTEKDEADLQPRTVFQTILCFIQGIASLAAIGLVVYYSLLTPLFAVTQEGIVYSLDLATLLPTTSDPSILAGLNGIIEAIMNTFIDIAEGVTPELVTRGLFYIAIALYAVALVIASLIAVIKFLVGMFSKKYFSLNGSVALVFGGSLMLYLVANLFSETLSEGVHLRMFVNSTDSAVLLGMMITGIALAVGFIVNVLYSPKFFARFKSIWKIIAAAASAGGAFLLVYYFPFGYRTFDVDSASIITTGNSVEVLMAEIANIIESAAGGDIFATITMIFTQSLMVLVSSIGTIFLAFYVPAVAYIQAKRLSVCFSHRAKRESSKLSHAITLLIFGLLIAVPLLIQTSFNFEILLADQTLMYFMLGIVAVFIGSILYKFGCEPERDYL